MAIVTLSLPDAKIKAEFIIRPASTALEEPYNIGGK
jgi:hypothetical protein